MFIMLVVINFNPFLLYTSGQKIPCLKKVHPFCFSDYSVSCWPILLIVGNIAAEKICNQMTYSFLNISSLCMNITE